MKIKTFLLMYCAMLALSVTSLANEPPNGNEVSIDIRTNNVSYRISSTPTEINVYDNLNNTPSPLFQFPYNTSKIARFNQYDIVAGYCEDVLGQDIRSPFVPTCNIDRIRYRVVKNIFSNDKFIVSDINGDGLLDFVRIEERNTPEGTLYEHLVYLQSKDHHFLEIPDKTIKGSGSSWISGIYFDVNGDGLPEKIGIKYKKFGAMMSNSKCTVSLYSVDATKASYQKNPYTQITTTGMFYELNNFTDVNGDGYPDLYIVDVERKPTSFEALISKLLDRSVVLIIKVYFYKDGVREYSQTPSFVKKATIDPLKPYVVSFPKKQGENTRDVLVTQLEE